MESVRKGKGLKPEWEEDMKAHGVPDWYIWSCKKIKYMFPKAHAAAYVMMAWRIAYCKIFYPLAYYAAFFSIRASAFSYEIMCQGRDKLEYYLADYKKRSDTLSKKEQDTLRDMRIVQEMYARGFDFMPIDIYKAKARHFQIIDGKLMPSLSSIDGLGEKAADAVVDDDRKAFRGAFALFGNVERQLCLHSGQRRLAADYLAGKFRDIGARVGEQRYLGSAENLLGAGFVEIPLAVG